MRNCRFSTLILSEKEKIGNLDEHLASAKRASRIRRVIGCIAFLGDSLIVLSNYKMFSKKGYNKCIP